MENAELKDQSKMASEEANEQPKELSQDELLKDQFETASEEVKELPKKPTQDEQLKLYGLFKQANSGDIDIDQPGMFEFEKKAKWGAWNKNKGMSQPDAMTEYIALVKELQTKYTE
ncbi:hypothetical protein IW147_003688 [Coemansia sp. RSA 720]|nr:hypothetical protein LPJ76_003292 [Coemansia sp. RSA 638]KAJ2122096.1 hypothetical protein IW147_003688 [Coemansia sp. RSA 720]